MSWSDFLVFMRGPGINAAIGVLLFFAVEWWPAFETLAPRMKRMAVLILCMVIPLLATLLSVVTLGLPISDWAGTWWPAIVAGAAAFGASTVAHTSKLPSG
jgi:hypothetical protein